jgi:hypothetical protein
VNRSDPGYHCAQKALWNNGAVDGVETGNPVGSACFFWFPRERDPPKSAPAYESSPGSGPCVGIGGSNPSLPLVQRGPDLTSYGNEYGNETREQTIMRPHERREIPGLFRL